MPEPKIIKGWLGWAVVGDGLMIYAKTKKEAMHRYQAASRADAPLPKLRELAGEVSSPERIQPDA